MLFLAGSCVQGLNQIDGLRELLRLAPDGIQLTSGWFPVEGFRALMDRLRLPQRLHHGFSWTAYRQPVWVDGALRVQGEPGRPLSVHPPDEGSWMDAASEVVVEVMPPGHGLSSSASLAEAMARGLWLAVDVSHLELLELAGVPVDAVWDYARIAEIHLSASDGVGDVHRAPAPGGYGMAWARERGQDGVPRVLECRMTGMTLDERQRVVEAVRSDCMGRPALSYGRATSAGCSSRRRGR